MWVVEFVVDVAFEPFSVTGARDGLSVLVGLVAVVGLPDIVGCGT
jgi:hypothetical protein